MLKGGMPSLNCVRALVGNIGESSSVSITSEDRFLEMNNADINTITSLRFEGIALGEKFFEHFCEVMGGEFDRVEFARCNLEEGVTFAEILDSCNVVNLSIVDCSISGDDLAEVLMRINPYCIKTIDLSGSRFDRDVTDILKKELSSRLSLNSIKLDGTALVDLSQLEGLCHE